MSIQKSPLKQDITLEWLNAVLSHKIPDIKAFEWKGRANQNRGVLSTLDRIELTLVSGRTVSVILKTLPSKGTFFHHLAVAFGYADREFKTYSILFPLWDKFLEDRNVPDCFRARKPLCYYSSSSGTKDEEDSYETILILEDLCDSGFQLWVEGYDKSLKWEEAKPHIKWLANWHALGIAYKEVEGITSYNASFPFLRQNLSPRLTVEKQFFQIGFDIVYKIVEEFSKDTDSRTRPLPVGFIDYLDGLRENAAENFVTVFDIFPNDRVGTVCHFDYHINNIMYSQANLEEVTAFDFQACSNSTPAVDLAFFLIQSCEESLLMDNFPDTIQYYYEELFKALQAMGRSDVLVSYGIDDLKNHFMVVAPLCMLHVIASLGQTIKNGEQDTKRRFYNKLVYFYNNGMLNYKEFNTS